MFRNTLIIASLLLLAACGSTQSQYVGSVSCDPLTVPVTERVFTVQHGPQMATVRRTIGDYNVHFNHDGSADTTMTVSGQAATSLHDPYANERSEFEGQDDAGAQLMVTTDFKAKTVEITVTTDAASQTYTVTSECQFE